VPIVLVSIVVAFFVHSLSVVPLGIALLVGALPNPACMGLQTLARELARGDTADFGEQRQALRMYWRVSLRAWSIAAAIAASDEPESFRSLLLRYGGRTGLIQRDFGARIGVSLRAVQAWEAGVAFPSSDRLQALLRVPRCRRTQLHTRASSSTGRARDS